MGPRQPSLHDRRTDPTTAGIDLTPHWPDGTQKHLQYATGTALGYHPGQPAVPLCGVLLRDPAGHQKPQALLRTAPHRTPATILTWYLRRGQREVTFPKVRAPLGVQTPPRATVLRVKG